MGTMSWRDVEGLNYEMSTVLADRDDKEYKGDDKIGKDNIFSGWWLILQIEGIWYLIRKIDPIKAVQKEEWEEGGKLDIDESINGDFVEFVNKKDLAPNRNLPFVVACFYIKLRVILFLFPVDQEVVSTGGHIIDEEEDGEKEEAKLGVKQSHKRMVQRVPIIDEVRHQ